MSITQVYSSMTNRLKDEINHRHIDPWLGYEQHGRGDCLGCVVDGYTTTCAISAYHNFSCEFESGSWRGLLDTTLNDKVYQ